MIKRTRSRGRPIFVFLRAANRTAESASGTERLRAADEEVSRAACGVVRILHRTERSAAHDTGPRTTAVAHSAAHAARSAGFRGRHATALHAAAIHSLMGAPGHSHREDDRQQNQPCILHCLLFPFGSFSGYRQACKALWSLPREPAPRCGVAERFLSYPMTSAGQSAESRKSAELAPSARQVQPARGRKHR